MFRNKRVLSLVLAFNMMFSLLPTQIFAVETENVESQIETAEENIVVASSEIATDEILEGAVSISCNAAATHRYDGTNWMYMLKNSGESVQPEKIVVENNSSQILKFSINEERLSGVSNITLNEVEIAHYSFSVNPGEKLTIGFSIMAGKSGVIFLTGFDFEDATQTIVQFNYDDTLGSITVDGEPVADGESIEIPAAGVDIVATPTSGSGFLAWINASNNANTLISNSASYHFVPEGQTAVKVAFTNPDAPAWFRAGANYYSNDPEQVFGYSAGSEHAADKTVVLVSDGALQQDSEIPAGVTLLIPYNTAHTLCTTEPTITRDSMVTPTAFRTLTMESGVDLTVRGALSVSGTATAVTFQGHVHGPYGHIKMQSGSSISVEENANLYAWGFISGSGSVAVKNGGTVYENFQTLGWRGADITNKMNQSRQTYKLFPLSQFYVQNVEVPMTFYPGAAEKVFFASSVMEEPQTALVTFVGEDGLFRITSGSMTKDYNESTDCMDFTVSGSANLEAISLTVGSGWMSVSINSADFHLPIPAHFKITVERNASLNISNDCSILPGAELIIEEGAAVNVAAGKSIIVYDVDEWSTKEEYQYNNGETVPVGSGFVFIGSGDRHIRPVYYTTSRGTSSPRGTTSEKLKDAKVQINGTLNAAGAYLYTTEGGADICSTGGGTLSFGNASADFKEYQVIQGGYDNGDLIYVPIANTPAKLKNADGTYKQTSGASTLYYNDGAWGTTQSQKAAKVVWKNGDTHTEFYSVQEALNAAVNSGDSVVLLRDETLSEPLVVQHGYNVVLDLDGKTLTSPTDTVLTNYGKILITGNGTLKSEQLVAENTDNIYTYADAVRNHGTMEITNVTIQTYSTGYRVGLLNYPEGTITDINNVTINATSANGYAIYNFGTVDAVSKLNVTAYYGYVARGESSYTDVFGAKDSVVSLNTSNIAIWARNGAEIDMIGADGSTIYIDKGRTGNTTIAGNTGIYVSSDASIKTLGGAGSTLHFAMKNPVYVTGSISDGIGTIDTMGEPDSYIHITSTDNGILLEGGASIDTIGNGGNIQIRANGYGINLNAAGCNIGTIASKGTVTVVSTTLHAVRLSGDTSVGEIGAGLKALALTKDRYALRITGATTDADTGDVTVPAASVGLISGGYYYTLNGTRALAIDKYSSQTYPKDYSLKSEPVTIEVDGTQYSALVVCHDHVYGDIVFNWADDHSSATASMTCSTCDESNAGHTLSGICDVISAENRGYLASITLNGQFYTDFISKIGDGMKYNKDVVLSQDEALNVVPHTFEAWINVPTSIPNGSRGGVILGSYNAVNKEKYINFELNTYGRPRLCWHDGTKAGSIIFEQDVRTGEWMHLAITHDGTNVKCYINGKLVETQDAPAGSDLDDTLDLAANLALGNDHRTGTKYPFLGEIASVAVYADVRNAEEILADTMTPGKQDLLVHYEVNSDTGTEIIDLSGKGYHIGHEHSYEVTFDWAQNYESATATATCAKCGESENTDCKIVSMNGRYEAIATFDGKDYPDRVFDLKDGMNVNPGVIRSVGKALEASPLTYEAWIKLDKNTGRVVIFGSYPNKGGQSYINFEIHNNGNPRLCWHTGNAADGAIFTDVDVRTGKWLHLSIVRDGNMVRCYVDGEPAGQPKTVSVAMPALPDQPLATNPVLGNDYRGTMNFSGEIASVAMYTDVRTQSEIYADMIVPGEDDLLIHYEVNSSSGDGSITDLSQNGYDIGGHTHEYTVTFDWADDYTSATATATCSKCDANTEGHSVTEDCEISVLGTRGYKATVTIADKEYTDEKYVMDGMSFTENYIYAPTKPLDSSSTPITVEAWINLPADTTRAVTIWGSYPGGKGRYIGLEIQTNGYPRLSWSDRDDNTSAAATGDIRFDSTNENVNGNVRTGEWMHISVVYDSVNDQASYYLNGEFVKTQGVYSGRNAKLADVGTPKKVMALGADFSSGNIKWFDGQIASVVAYSEARSQDEIKTDMISPGVENRIVHYEVNSSSVAGNIPDLSGNGYDIVTPWVEVEEPEGYAYSFMVIGDTQKAVRQYPDDVKKIYDYVVKNVAKKNVKFVFGLGDIVDYNILKEPGLTAQWDAIVPEIKAMNGVVPYSVIRGNHDEVENFNKYFPVSEYTDSIGGYLNDMRNTWQTFRVGDIKYLVVNLDFGPTEDMIAWANEVITRHPDHNVIITTHSYLQKDKTTLDGTESASPTLCYDEWYKEWSTAEADRQNHYDGDDMWNALVSKHDNIVLLLCGHDPSAKIVTAQSKGENGNTVTQMLIDGQDVDRDMIGGVGLVATFYISEDGRDVTVDYYSTFQEKYFMAENQFTTTMDVHAWDDGKLDPKPDCTTDGAMVYTCTSCETEHTKTVTVEALGHLYDENGVCERGCGTIHSGSASGEGIPVGTEVAQIIGSRAYDTLEAAVTAADEDDCIQMLTDSMDAATINKAVFIDLNGLAVSNLTISARGVQFMDSSANSYGTPAGNVTVVSGENYIADVSTFAYEEGMTSKYYIKVAGENNTYTFHRVAVHVTGIQFALAMETNPTGYLTFRGTFRGDTDAAKNLKDVGFMFNNNNENRTWFGTEKTAALIPEVQKNTYTHFYYTEQLSGINDIAQAAALMQLGDVTCDGASVDVKELLRQIKNASLDDAVGWTPEQKKALADYLSSLNN